ncbi:MAG: metallophosphoesterase [Saprospiraceae bacterium]
MESKILFKDFIPQKAVAWLSFFTLIHTLKREQKVKKSNDERESSNSFRDDILDCSKTTLSEYFIDYVSDTGDGFNETLSVLNFVTKDIELENKVLKQGELLLFGGDQCYPYSSYDNYANRLFGPFLLAQTLNNSAKNLFELAPEKTLIALPGNHDWYDGLNSFTEYFCCNKIYGTYKANQGRSYGAVKLKDNLWIWYLDMQLSENLNNRQIAYFTELVNQHQKGDAFQDQLWNIILSVPQPYWFQKTIDWDDKMTTQIERFISELFLRKNPYTIEASDNCEGKTYKKVLSLKLILTGDIHHYHRFSLRLDQSLNESIYILNKHVKPIQDNLQLITSGGGGAYSYPTHHLEDRTSRKPFQARINNHVLHYEKCYPDAFESWKQCHSCVWNILAKNFSFSLYILIAYLVFGFVNFLDLQKLTLIDPQRVQLYLWLNIVGFIIIPGGIAYSMTDRLDKSFKNLEYYHKFGWILLVVALCLLNITVCIFCLRLYESLFSYFHLSFYLILGLLSIVSTFIFGLYIYLSHINFKLHDNEVFSISQINRFKNFLRIKIDKEKITIYPIGIPDINKKLIEYFKYNDDASLIEALNQTKIEKIEQEIEIAL